MANDRARQLRQTAERLWEERWTFDADMNGDGVVNLSDVWLWVNWLFFAPGDLLLLLCMTHLPELAVFLEIDPTLVSGPLSGTLFFCFLLVFIAFMTLVFVFLENELSRGRIYILSLAIWLPMICYGVYYFMSKYQISINYIGLAMIIVFLILYRLHLRVWRWIQDKKSSH